MRGKAVSQQITSDQPQSKCEQSDSATKHFNLPIAYRLLISAYIRSTGNIKRADNQQIERIKHTKQTK